MRREEYSCAVDYDLDFDFLSFRREGFKSTGSIVAGQFTLDLCKNELVGLEIEEASSLFESLFPFKLDLTKIGKSKIGFVEKNNSILLYFTITYGKCEYQKELILPKITPVPVLA